VPLERFDQALFSELLSRIVERFGDPIGIEHQQVSRKEPALGHRVIALRKEPHYRGGGIEPFHAVVTTEEQRREVPAVRIAQLPHPVVIFGKEERRVGALVGILVKELVY